MRLHTVNIKNYRCFEEVNVELDEITVLIGENNSGKTSFLDAIQLCLSRAGMRRGGGLDDYDYHLTAEKKELEQIEPLSITLDFLLDEKEPDDLVQALGEIIVFAGNSSQHVILRLHSNYDVSTRSFETDWDFLDAQANPLGPKAKSPRLLTTFLQFTPVFYLSALRDSAKEFRGRSTFWEPFLKNPAIPEEVRDRLQAEVRKLNSEVLAAHAPLQAVKKHLAKVQDIVASGKGGTVDIEALPARVFDLLNGTQVNFTGPTGVSLPLASHGSGTQSLAVIFLFWAFVSTMLDKQYDVLSRPLLALEEPEAHLHPCAVRSLWVSLNAITGQKIVATHSGDLLARVPLTAIRRFCREDGRVTVRRLPPNSLTEDEEKRIDFHLQSCRGELLFARCWLIAEGESEYWVFKEAAEMLGYDFDQVGVRFVNSRYSGVDLLLKVATELGIGWYFVGDNDSQGHADEAACQKYLAGKDAVERICVLPSENLEVLLCDAGFGALYEGWISAQKRHLVTLGKGSPGYWAQVIGAQPNKGKPARIREVTAEMRNRGMSSIPTTIKEIIEHAIAITGAQA